MTKENGKARTRRDWILIVIYLPLAVAMYFWATKEVTSNFTEAHERGFRVAAVRLDKAGSEPQFVTYTLQDIKAGKVDLASVTFLLPRDVMEIPGGDTHKATVLQRHPDWQLIEYHFGNTHSSTSRYRAFKDRVEAVSYRITMHIGIFIWAVLLVLPAWLISTLVNKIWNAVARRRARANGAL